jgi:hypothetical protein
MKWHSAMESKRISIDTKVPGAYHKSQYIMDYLDASLTVDAKSFNAEINILLNRYLHGNPDNGMHHTLLVKSLKHNNMFEDETWKQELGEQIRLLLSLLS